VALCLAHAAAGNGDEGDRARPRDPLTSAQAAIEEAFGRSDPQPLRPLLSRRLKVDLAADSLGIDAGYYGADQALLILRRVFAGRATMRFALEPLRAAAADDERTTRARWVFRHRGVPGAEVRLSFTLMTDGDAWFVREIRELR
jgi:hypothetical protein